MGSARPLVVVLGASGFVASAVNVALARQPIRLRLVSRRPPVPPRDATAEVDVRAVDLTADGALAEAVAGANAVVHLVSHNSGGWRIADGDPTAERINVGLVRDLVAAVATGPPPTVVFAGTCLNGHDRFGSPEPPGRPRSPYCRQKLAAEHLLEKATADGVLRGVAVRLPAVYGYGPGDGRLVVEAMIRKALAGEPLTMWHDGTVRRDLVHLDDVASAVVAAIDHADALAGRFWLIGSGRAEPLGAVFTEIADLVAAHTGRPPVPVVSVPPPANAEPTDTRSVEIDASPFRAITGWRPRVALRDGLDRTVAALADAVGVR